MPSYGDSYADWMCYAILFEWVWKQIRIRSWYKTHLLTDRSAICVWNVGKINKHIYTYCVYMLQLTYKTIHWGKSHISHGVADGIIFYIQIPPHVIYRKSICYSQNHWEEKVSISYKRYTVGKSSGNRITIKSWCECEIRKRQIGVSWIVFYFRFTVRVLTL